MNNVLIYGAGAIGGWIGTNLAVAGHNVAFVARPYQIETIQQHGLPVLELEAKQLLVKPLTAFSSLRDALINRVYDLVILSVKTYHLPEVAADLAAHYPAAPMVLVTQNGIEVERPITAVFGRDRVLASAITAPIRKREDGVLVSEKAGRGLALAPLNPELPIERWVKLFDNTFIKAAAVRDYRAMKWSKALFNLIGNATSAILNWHPQQIYRHPKLFKLEMGMFSELLALMDQLQIKPVKLAGVPAPLFAWGLRYFPRPLLQLLFRYIIEAGRGDKMPSFNLDLWAGKQENEVLYHNVALAEIGRENGVAMPINQKLGRIVLQLAHGTLPRPTFEGQPEKLLQKLAQP